MTRKTLAFAALSVLFLTPACAESGSNLSKTEIEKIVHEYIVEHPEVIEEALIALSEREKAAAAERASAAIISNADKLYKDANAPFVGDENAEVTVVEFFDYRCGYCKRSTDWIRELPKKYDGKVRVVYKELPIFGGISETAALAALAAHKQDKYLDMHLGLMNIKNNSDLTDAKIDEVAKAAGIDVTKMRADMKSMEIQKQLADDKALGRELGVDGTPAFFVGGTNIVGADQRGLYAAIEEELK